MAEQNSHIFQIRITPSLKKAIEHAAKRSAMTVSDWARCTLAVGAQQGAFAPPSKTKRSTKRKGA